MRFLAPCTLLLGAFCSGQGIDDDAAWWTTAPALTAQVWDEAPLPTPAPTVDVCAFQQGYGVADSEQFVGNTASEAACLELVQTLWPEANGATRRRCDEQQLSEAVCIKAVNALSDDKGAIDGDGPCYAQFHMTSIDSSSVFWSSCMMKMEGSTTLSYGELSPQASQKVVDKQHN